MVRKNQKADESVKPVEWAKPGSLHGYEKLASFITNRIKIYDTKRNDPNVKGRKISKTLFHAFKIQIFKKKWMKRVCPILPLSLKWVKWIK